VNKLREYGKYTIGIGLQHATGDLLLKSCDEFIFYESLLGRDLSGGALDGAQARELLTHALGILQQQGGLPVMLSRLKQTMVALDPAFNEANLGPDQLAGFLRAQPDLVRLEQRNRLLYVSLADRAAPVAAAPAVGLHGRDTVLPLGEQYRHQLRRAGRMVLDMGLRRGLLDDLHRLCSDGRDDLTLNRAADLLHLDDENGGGPTIRAPGLEVCKLTLLGEAVPLRRPRAGLSSPLAAAPGSADAFRRAAESVYVQKVAEAGLELSFADLSLVLFDTATEGSYLEELLEALRGAGRLAPRGDGRYGPPDDWAALLQLPTLASAVAELDACPLGNELVTAGAARGLFEAGNTVRSSNFAQASERYLRAARVQLEAIRNGTPGAGCEDFWWYFANFLATRAGAAFSESRFALAVPYYLAFFALLREGEPLWDHVLKLVNVMLSYYFATAAKQVGASPGRNPGYTHPLLMAVSLQHHQDSAVVARWEELIAELVYTNSALVEMLLDYAGLIPADPAQVENTTRTLHRLLADWYARAPADAPLAS
jgi:hypothetical protein